MNTKDEKTKSWKAISKRHSNIWEKSSKNRRSHTLRKRFRRYDGRGYGTVNKMVLFFIAMTTTTVPHPAREKKNTVPVWPERALMLWSQGQEEGKCGVRPLSPGQLLHVVALWTVVIVVLLIREPQLPVIVVEHHAPDVKKISIWFGTAKHDQRHKDIYVLERQKIDCVGESGGARTPPPLNLITQEHWWGKNNKRYDTRYVHKSMSCTWK